MGRFGAIRRKVLPLHSFCRKRRDEMIIIPLKEGENIERALKRFKRKFERTGTMRELRSRQAYVKPSVSRREEIQHAKYIQQLQDKEEL